MRKITNCSIFLILTVAVLVANQAFAKKFITPTVYNLPSTTTGNQWIKVGTMTIPNSGYYILDIKIVGQIGYPANASSTNQDITNLLFSSSGTTDANGFSGSGQYSKWGYGQYGVINIKTQSNASGTSARSYDFYIQVNQYFSGYYEVNFASGASWTNVSTISNDPGSVSSSIAQLSYVAKIKGKDIILGQLTNLVSGHYLKYDGTNWVNLKPNLSDFTNDINSVNGDFTVPGNLKVGGKTGLGFTTPLNLLHLKSSDSASAIQFNAASYPTQWGARIFTKDSYNGFANGVDLAFEFQNVSNVWNKSVVFGHGQDNNHPSLRTWYNTYLATSNGKVGITTTAPNSTLDLGNASTQSDYHYPLLWLNDNNTSVWHGKKSGIYMDQLGLTNNTSLLFSSTSTSEGTFVIASKKITDSTASSIMPRIIVKGETGQVGIGTTLPLGKLHVKGNSEQNSNGDWTTTAVFEGTNPAMWFLNSNGSTDFQIGLASGSGAFNQFAQSGDFILSKVNTFGQLYISNSMGGNIYFTTGKTGYNSESKVLSIFNNGTIGIGTNNLTDTSYKLYVEKGIRTRKVKVDVDTWADYVFAPSYKLMPLQDLETYIKSHQHLPDVPTTEAVNNSGIDVAENQSLLLKKVEELTLYLIEQSKKLEYQNKRIADLEAQLQAISSEKNSTHK
jgi:hypothetical protein